MRKMLSIILAAGIIFGLTATAMAVQNPDYGYVIVKCTVTLSVDVEDNATAYFSTGNEPDRYVISAGSGFDYVSISSITVKNDSHGAICQWALQVSTIEYSESWSPPAWNGDNRWTLGDSAGVQQAVLCAVFATSRPVTDDFSVPGDTLSVTTDKIWTHTTKLDPEDTVKRYSSTNPNGYNGTNKVVNPDDRRALWFRFIPPTAVIDEWYRRFTIKVTAALLGS